MCKNALERLWKHTKRGYDKNVMSAEFPLGSWVSYLYTPADRKLGNPYLVIREREAEVDSEKKPRVVVAHELKKYEGEEPPQLWMLSAKSPRTEDEKDDAQEEEEEEAIGGMEKDYTRLVHETKVIPAGKGEKVDAAHSGVMGRKRGHRGQPKYYLHRKVGDRAVERERKNCSIWEEKAVSAAEEIPRDRGEMVKTSREKLRVEDWEIETTGDEWPMSQRKRREKDATEGELNRVKKKKRGAQASGWKNDLWLHKQSHSLHAKHEICPPAYFGW